jgi:DNA-binding MarR family transcriptional regulator
MPATPAISRLDYETLAAFRRALSRFLHFSAEAARRVGLTAQQHQALLALKGFPGGRHATVGEFAEQLQIRHHSAVGLIDRLARRGLVHRRHDNADRRLVRVALTPRGNGLIRRLSAAHKAELKTIGPQLRRTLDLLALD